MSAAPFTILDAAVSDQRGLTRVRRAVEAAASARAELAQAIRAAIKEGHTYKDVAEAAGLSSSRVHQIVHEDRG